MVADPEVTWAHVGAVDLAYTLQGDPQDPLVLLVAGLGAQLITWDDGFCQELVDRGLFVVRFDNRDAGLSTHLGEDPPGPPYGLSDLAADVAGLIEALGLGPVHVVGASMGGMVVQVLALEHPGSVASLTSIMSTTGDPAVGEASAAAIALLMSPPATTRAAVIEGAVSANQVTGSPAYPTPADVVRARAARAFDRAYNPAGTTRQLRACMAAVDRTQGLGQLDVPALVIHGAADPLIGVSGGRASAAAIPGSELLVLEGVGHELPEPVWGVVADRIAALVRRAELVRPTSR